MSEETIFDKILGWYAASPKQKSLKPLSADEEKILERWDFINQLYMRHRPGLNQMQIMHMTMEKFSISRRQYFYDRTKAHELWGEFAKYDKQSMIAFQVEHYKQLRSLAEQDRDYRAAAKCSERIDKLLKLESDEIDSKEVQITHIQIILGTGPALEDNRVIPIDHLQRATQQDFDLLLEAANKITPDPDQIVHIIKESQAEGEDDAK